MPMKTVLYVEDNEFNLELIRQAFKTRKKIRFIYEKNGEAGLKTALKELPDLVLLDINLPGLNGREILKKLKEDAATAHIPVIAISADALVTQIEESMKMGFLDYVTKPIDLSEFLAKIDQVLASTNPKN